MSLEIAVEVTEVSPLESCNHRYHPQHEDAKSWFGVVFLKIVAPVVVISQTIVYVKVALSPWQKVTSLQLTGSNTTEKQDSIVVNTYSNWHTMLILSRFISPVE